MPPHDPAPLPPPDDASNKTPADKAAPIPVRATRTRGGDRAKRRPRVVHHFKVDHALRDADRGEYETLLLDPRQTCDSLLAWLVGRGYAGLSRAAVARHRRQFEADVKDVRKNARAAHHFSVLARSGGGPAAFADAAQLRFEQMFLEQLFSMESNQRLTGREWAEFARAMGDVLDNRRRFEALKAEWERRAAKAAEAVEQAGTEGKAAFNGVEIANCVRRILGVPLPGEPVPEYRPEQQRETAHGRAIANEVREILGEPPVDLPRLPGGEPSEN